MGGRLTFFAADPLGSITSVGKTVPVQGPPVGPALFSVVGGFPRRGGRSPRVPLETVPFTRGQWEAEGRRSARPGSGSMVLPVGPALFPVVGGVPRRGGRSPRVPSETVPFTCGQLEAGPGPLASFRFPASGPLSRAGGNGSSGFALGSAPRVAGVGWWRHRSHLVVGYVLLMIPSLESAGQSRLIRWAMSLSPACFMPARDSGDPVFAQTQLDLLAQ